MRGSFPGSSIRALGDGVQTLSKSWSCSPARTATLPFERFTATVVATPGKRGAGGAGAVCDHAAATLATAAAAVSWTTRRNPYAFIGPSLLRRLARRAPGRPATCLLYT